MLEIESSFSTSLDSLLRALTCHCWRMDVLHRYKWYDLPNRRRRDFMKSGAMPALSSRTGAQTFPECLWGESFDFVFGQIGMGCPSNWVQDIWYLVSREVLFLIRLVNEHCHGFIVRLAKPFCSHKNILYAALTGQRSGWLLSETIGINWPFCLFFWILKITFIFFGRVITPPDGCFLMVLLFLS